MKDFIFVVLFDEGERETFKIKALTVKSAEKKLIKQFRQFGWDKYVSDYWLLEE